MTITAAPAGPVFLDCLTGGHARCTRAGECRCRCHANGRGDGWAQARPASGGSPASAGGAPAPRRVGWSPARVAYAFYGVAATGAVIGQTWVAVEHIAWPATWPVWAAVVAVLPFAACLELLAMALAAMGDQRQRAGEQAYGFRVFSAVVAVLAVGIIVVGHHREPYLAAAFGVLSGSAYLLWLLHGAARRRDALRAAGLLDTTTPVYGVWRRLRHPVWCARAAELARAQGLGLHESLAEALRRMRAEKRRPAIARAVERVVRADHADPLMAEIASATLDLDRIAEVLERRADYDGWAERLAAALDPRPANRPDGGTPDKPTGGMPPETEADTPQTPAGGVPTPARRGTPRPRRVARQKSAAERVAAARQRHPDATQAELARRAGVSLRTVARHDPRPAGTPSGAVAEGVAA